MRLPECLCAEGAEENQNKKNSFHSLSKIDNTKRTKLHTQLDPPYQLEIYFFARSMSNFEGALLKEKLKKSPI